MERRDFLKYSILVATPVVVFEFSACTPPSWVIEAENIAQLSLPIVGGIAAITGIGAPVALATTAISLLIGLFQKYQSTPAVGTLAEIEAALAAANGAIGQIAAASGIKNPATEQKIAAILQLVTQEFTQIANLIQPVVASMRVGAVAPAQMAQINYRQFKRRYNALAKSKTGDPETDARHWMAVGRQPWEPWYAR